MNTIEHEFELSRGHRYLFGPVEMHYEHFFSAINESIEPAALNGFGAHQDYILISRNILYRNGWNWVLRSHFALNIICLTRYFYGP